MCASTNCTVELRSLSSGAGSSKGTASWTSKPELVDYISFTGLFVHYINDTVPPSSVEPSPIQSRAPPGLTRIQSTSAITSIPITQNLPAALLILGGYSYGSLIASHLPSIEAILDKFTNIAKGSVEAEIRLRAHSLSTQWNKGAHESRKGQGLRANHKLGDSTRISFGGEETEPGSRRTSRESRRSLDVIRRSVDRSRKLILRTQCAEVDTSNEAQLDFKKIAAPQICYLLISPLLPPISLFLTMFSKLSGPSPFKDGACSSQSKRRASSAMGEHLVNHPTLAIYGDSDFFTSKKNLRKWAEGLSERPDSMFRFREIGGAGHFWQEQGVDAKMRASLREWLQSCRIC